MPSVRRSTGVESHIGDVSCWLLPWSSGAGGPAVWVRFARYVPSFRKFSRWLFEMKLSSLRPKEMKRVRPIIRVCPVWSQGVEWGGGRRIVVGGGRGNRGRWWAQVGVHRGFRVDRSG